MKRLTEITSTSVGLQPVRVRGCFGRGTVLRIQRKTLPFFLFCLLFTASTVGIAYGQNQYRECQEKAMGISGYDGPVPDKHLPGGVLSGAAKGAGAGALFGWIAKKDKSKAAKRGAAIGALFGAIKRSAARKEIARRQRIYQQELDECMAASSRKTVSSHRAAAIRKAALIREAASSRRTASSPKNNRGPTGTGEGAFDLEYMACSDVLSAPEEDRTFAYLLLYGYVAGKRYDAIHSAKRIEGTLSNFANYSQPLDKPAAEAMAQAFVNTRVAVNPEEEFNLATITCWEIGSVPEENYAFAQLLVYGYASGQLEQSRTTVETIKNTLVRVENICARDVETSTAEVFTKSLRAIR